MDASTPREQGFYFTVCADHGGYTGCFRTREDAEHARRLLYGIRATAHPIVNVSARWGDRKPFDDPNEVAAMREP